MTDKKADNKADKNADNMKKGTRNIRVVLQYDGSRYDGWQKQGNTERTIQGKLEQILEKMCGFPVEVHGSGRTDAGVHALGQVANFHLPSGLSGWTPDQIRDYMNHYLPEDIAVLSAEEAFPRFHSRLNAVSKTYLYRIETAAKKDVFERKYVYGLGKRPDPERMRRAAVSLLGTHDFRGFSSLKKFKKSTVRTISSIKIREQGTILEVEYTGSGFLYNMVRILTGTLIEVGLQERSEASVAEVLSGMDRGLAGYTAPAEGLFLKEVHYPEEM